MVTAGADGAFSVQLTPGVYRLIPAPVDGLLGTAAPVELRVRAGDPVTDLAIAYDTGIR